MPKFNTMKYKRILLKLSGESLMGAKQFGIDNDIYHITKMMKTTSCDEKEN